MADVNLDKLSEDCKGDGEPWDAYAHRLERRVKHQRELLRDVQALRKVPGDKQARQHIAALERALGRMTDRWQRARDDRDALVDRVRLLDEALTALEPLLSVRLDGSEDMAGHADALAGLERAREIVARALRGEG